ncbi:MAG: response regulator [Oscillospiraceae bacterium]|nr:response regulator [Oscillospiraceae bacterium]
MENKTIYLVDNGLSDMLSCKEFLEQYYTIVSLRSGKDLFEAIQNNLPDLILLDIEADDTDGYDTLSRLKENEHTNEIPVIILTAAGDTMNEIRALSLGASDYIAKPFSSALLHKRIELHILAVSQKSKLQSYNLDLYESVESKLKIVLEMKNAVLKTMAELVERRDYVTGGHIERTRDYLSVLTYAMIESGIYKNEIFTWNIELFLQSSQLHDVGKIAVRDSILKKTGRLTDEEFDMIKMHTTFGEKIIVKIRNGTSENAFLEHARILAVSHHEKWDGSGYPHGLCEEKIPLQGRLLAIADVYDALVSDRPYKKAFSHKEAVDIITDGRGKHFDPLLTDLFTKVSGKFNQIATEWQMAMKG